MRTRHLKIPTGSDACAVKERHTFVDTPLHSVGDVVGVHYVWPEVQIMFGVVTQVKDGQAVVRMFNKNTSVGMKAHRRHGGKACEPAMWTFHGPVLR
jgi:hypothetical protein